MFRANSDRDRSAVPVGHVPADRKPRAALADKDSDTVIMRHAPIHKIHRGRTDEAGDEHISRTVVEIERRSDLLDSAVVQDDDLVGHRHRFDLVVSDIDDRRLQSLMKLLDFRAHLHAQFGVEIRQRLIEQERLRVAHDRPSHGDALPLPAR